MDVFERLSRTPALLARVAAQMPDALVRLRSGPFALVEHAGAMPALGREGLGERVRRLIAEEDPFLPDFDGERIAREREYLMADLAPAVATFAAAREQTLRSLRRVSGGQWARSGRQEGVGTITLAEMPRRILDHDFAHLNEIADLLADLLPSHPMIAELRAIPPGGPKRSKGA